MPVDKYDRFVYTIDMDGIDRDKWLRTDTLRKAEKFVREHCGKRYEQIVVDQCFFNQKQDKVQDPALYYFQSRVNGILCDIAIFDTASNIVRVLEHPRPIEIETDTFLAITVDGDTKFRVMNTF